MSTPPRPFHPTWWMLAAASLVCLALGTTALGRAPAIPILWLAIAAAYFIPKRLPSGGMMPWILRGIVFMAVILTGPERNEARPWYTDVNFMTVLGMCLQAELAVQHWLPVENRMRLGQMLVLTGGVLLCASSSSEPWYIAVIAPLYVICILGVLREFRPTVTTSPVMNAPPPTRTSRRWLIQGVATVLAVTLGFAGGQSLRAAYFGLGGYSMRMLQKMLPLRTAGGMSGNERLGGNYDFTESTGRTLKIEGINRAMHLRGLAFDQYQHGAWKPDYRARVWTVVPELPAGDTGTSFTIERLEDSLGLLYLPLGATSFSTPARSTNQVENGHAAAVTSVTESGDMMTYDVRLAADDYQGPLCRPMTDQERDRLLQVPDDLEQGVRQIAQAIRQTDPKATIRSTVFYLHENHRYSLKSSFSDRDPVSEFLLERKSAHCQFFASAAAILLRLNGVPCRYVTGYFAHEGTSADAMVVRGRDAHAWVEAWVDGQGWVTVEATPANGTPQGLARDLSLYQRIKDFVSDVVSAAGRFVRSLRWHHIATAGGVLVLAAVSLQSIRNWRSRKQRPRIRGYTFPAEEYRRLATEFEMLLKRLGDPPSGAATWSEHLTTQKAQTRRTARQAQLDAAKAFVEQYNQIRFGRPDDAASLQRLRQLLDKVKES